jgi:TatD DNase family protein
MDYRIIDTHCHPQFPQYDEDRPETIRRALGSGIGMVCVGTDIDTSTKAIELADLHEGIYATVGLHPNNEFDTRHDDDGYYDELASLASHKKVVAIGEIGLDYYRTPDNKDRERQRSRFASQIDLARRLTLPAVIHCRDAHADMLSMVSKNTGVIRAVIHSFNGTVAEARSYLDAGYSIGLNAIVTFSKQYEEMVKFIPLDRLLLETDAPYLAPAPYRGKRNEPLYIEGVGNSIAAIRGIEASKLFCITTGNARDLFRLWKNI